MEKKIRYPIGEQSFENLRREGFLYVDKTMFIKRIVEGSKYYFLGRPRRFGKSLFLSTLKCFFEGKWELFNGLYADTMAWD
ncbi:MAG: AAA family ATPase, partial [Muribaculaceae bacterium]|nr:AAA family ATPase [Muribaculaceae bacterium]